MMYKVTFVLLGKEEMVTYQSKPYIEKMEKDPGVQILKIEGPYGEYNHEDNNQISN